MGESELKIALQREGEAQVRDLWRQAEDAVAARRAELEAKRLSAHAETDRRLQEAINTLRNNLLLDFQTRALESRLHAETALSERLLILARQELMALAEVDLLLGEKATVEAIAVPRRGPFYPRDFNQVNARYHFSYRVFNLDTGIHLHKMKILRIVH